MGHLFGKVAERRRREFGERLKERSWNKSKLAHPFRRGPHVDEHEAPVLIEVEGVKADCHQNTRLILLDLAASTKVATPANSRFE
jgi:hypothetical protein